MKIMCIQHVKHLDHQVHLYSETMLGCHDRFGFTNCSAYSCDAHMVELNERVDLNGLVAEYRIFPNFLEAVCAKESFGSKCR